MQGGTNSAYKIDRAELLMGGGTCENAKVVAKCSGHTWGSEDTEVFFDCPAECKKGVTYTAVMWHGKDSNSVRYISGNGQKTVLGTDGKVKHRRVLRTCVVLPLHLRLPRSLL